MPALDDTAIAALIERGGARPASTDMLVAQLMGGALARVDEDATAVGVRSPGWLVHVMGVWEDEEQSEANREWARASAAALRAARGDGRETTFINFEADSDQARVRAAFGDAKYRRLVALKDRYDPENLFTATTTCVPAAPGRRRDRSRRAAGLAERRETAVYGRFGVARRGSGEAFRRPGARRGCEQAGGISATRRRPGVDRRPARIRLVIIRVRVEQGIRYGA